MKKSAITRIVIYSVLTLLLIGLLASALVIHKRAGLHELTSVIQASEEFPDFDEEFHLGEDIFADDDDDDDDDEFDEDDDDEWHEDMMGSEASEQKENAASQEAAPGEMISIPGENISQIVVDWVSGSVTVVPGDVDAIKLQETSGKEPMVYGVKGSRLEIKFSRNLKKVSFGVNNIKSKDLTVTVPREWIGEKLLIHSVSADVEIRDLSLGEVEYQGVSGRLMLENASLNELSLETVSGNVTVNGQIRELECESVSADCDLTLTNVPSEISMEGVSGSLNLTLPQDAGFTVELDGLNKKLDTDFEVTGENGKFVAGDGRCEIEIEGVSGKARIRKAS